ncbi:hypothetical protein EJ08DRAFT_683194 [Tothia fuscella]|uniref:Uncharacterized protein n=1 Tax=Tothia fuscella TaxID=1048955 RepID=A0A9P4NH56_9PEZI|nr:hypothetical protein EJ08DRAFT_683194 [Tothia fuscella]
MPFKLDDRALWLSLGVFAFIAVRTISYALNETLRLTEIHEEPRKHFCDVCQDTEDAIKADSLSVLAKSSNLEIRQAAIRILCTRFLAIPANLRSLHHDSESSNPRTSHRAFLLYKLLLQHVPDHRELDSLKKGLENDIPFDAHNIHGVHGTPPAPRMREREESFEEQALRRRRREAIVLNEGDRPLSQDDIIQRNGSGSRVGSDRLRNVTETTRRVERLFEEIARTGDGGDVIDTRGSA